VSTAILLLAMFQAWTARPISPPRAQGSQMDDSAVFIPGFAEESLAADEDREFIRRLNGLARALNAFAETYQSGQVDLKKARAVQKAIHELEKSKWFRPPNAKSR
jgi:hypothetical protein